MAMIKQRLCLGVVKVGQKRIKTIETVRMDLLDRTEAIECLTEAIENAYDKYESEGEKYGSYDDSEERA